MSGSFAFGFGADEDESPESDNQHAISADLLLEEKKSKSVESNFQQYAIQQMLTTLPSTIHFTRKTISDGHQARLSLPQRDFPDLKTQLMAEDEDLGSISGINADDLEPGVYEGGLKTWECANDLSSFLLDSEGIFDQSYDTTTIIELGAGTAQPTCSLLLQLLQGLLENKQASSVKFKLTLADYNPRVLEVATVPNLLLSVASAMTIPMEEDMLELTSEIKQQILDALASCRIDISAVSGSWSTSFAESILSACQVGARSKVLILASETVYAPKSIAVFAKMLTHMLRTLEREGTQVRALIATKKIYFGVGGGLNEFTAAIRQFGATAQIVWQSADHSVERAIVSVSTSGT